MEGLRILSVDVEDWFHLLETDGGPAVSEWDALPSRIEPVMGDLLDLLEDAGVICTFYFLGWVAERFPALVRECRQRGHGIGCHSHFHSMVWAQGHAEFSAELARATAAIEDAAGERPRHFRAPGFSVRPGSEWFAEVLVEQGYESDSSIFMARRYHGGYRMDLEPQPFLIDTAAGALKELPVAPLRGTGVPPVVVGGGYFRLLPAWLMVRALLGSHYHATYFHPRDFDPDQPRYPGLSLARRFRAYVGIGQSRRKFRHLLREVSFLDVDRALATVDWDRVPRVKLGQET